MFANIHAYLVEIKQKNVVVSATTFFGYSYVTFKNPFQQCC